MLIFAFVKKIVFILISLSAFMFGLYLFLVLTGLWSVCEIQAGWSLGSKGPSKDCNCYGKKIITNNTLPIDGIYESWCIGIGINKPISSSSNGRSNAVDSFSYSEQECFAEGGRWAGDLVGRGVITGCVLNTSDAGKACSHSAQCEGACLATYNEFSPEPGRCNDESQYKGCGVLTKDTNGKIQNRCYE